MKLTSYLKALLSQFVSKNEKDFITQQALPLAIHSRNDGTGTGVYEYLVSPVNGYAFFQINSYDTSKDLSRIRAEMHYQDTEIIASSTFRDSTGVGSIFIPVRKGGKIGYLVTSGCTFSCKWISCS